uniref:Uncharacterized protein n=1 Tax=Scytalidium sp. TaxID=1715249 RepID=A0A513U0R2_9PEZI|nr:hypothetical protein [Scytalidium sp.]
MIFLFSCILLSQKRIYKIKIYQKFYIPKPYKFVNLTLQSGMNISNIVTEVNTLLPQLADFISQFNNLITQTGINVITDSSGNMSIDVPNSMPESEVNRLTTRIGIIDRLITNHGTSLNDLFQKGLSIENKLKTDNPNYVSQLSEQITEFKKLNASYKH